VTDLTFRSGQLCSDLWSFINWVTREAYYTTGCLNRTRQKNNWNRRCRDFLYWLIVSKRKQVFRLVYLNCVIFYNETNNVWLTIELITWFMRWGGGVLYIKKNKCFTIIIHIGSFIIKNHAVQIDQLNHWFSFRYRKKSSPLPTTQFMNHMI